MGEDEPVTVGSSSSGIDSSNIGFQVLTYRLLAVGFMRNSNSSCFVVFNLIKKLTC